MIAAGHVAEMVPEEVGDAVAEVEQLSQEPRKDQQEESDTADQQEGDQGSLSGNRRGVACDPAVGGGRGALPQATIEPDPGRLPASVNNSVLGRRGADGGELPDSAAPGYAGHPRV